MGSLILNINNSLLVKSVRYAASKKGHLQQCLCFSSYKHVLPPRSSSHLFRYSRKSEFSHITALRFASTVNIIETKPKVESSTTNLSQSDHANPSYSVEDNSDLKFVIVRDKGKGVEEITSGAKPEIQIDESALPPIPTPPVNEVTTDAVTKIIDPEVLAKLLETGGEQSLADVGLGFCWYVPTSYIRSIIEYVHVTFDIPWWGSIVISTLVLRTILLPVYLKSRRHIVEFANKSPRIQEIQMEQRAAIMAGDNMRAAILSHDMAQAVRELRYGKAMAPMFVQACLFLPFFWALRSMANLPVESMKHGGALWFVDLTIPDQFYILPITTSATLGLMLWLGTDSVKIKDVTSNVAKGVMIVMPVVLCCVSLNFPAAVLCYWSTTNFYSLGQNLLVRIPAVQEYFQLPKPIQHKKKDLASSNFIQNMKDSYQSTKLLNEVQRREQLNQRQFEAAGKSPIVRTFKKNPLLAQSKPT